jgi:flagellar motor protein MotB
MRATVTGLIVLLTGLGGCVPAKKYHQLEADYADLRLKYDAATAKSEGLSLQVSDLEEHVTTLRQRSDYLGSFYEDLLTEFRPQLENDEIELIVYPDRMTMALAQDVSFSTGSASLTKTGDETLGKMANLLERHPERRFVVEGHTDDVPISTDRYASNWELGAARAVAVVKELIESGVPADRLAAATYGDTEPLAANTSDEGRRQNRRVEISFQPTLEELPGHASLMEAARQVTYADGANGAVVPEMAKEKADYDNDQVPADQVPPGQEEQGTDLLEPEDRDPVIDEPPSNK